MNLDDPPPPPPPPPKKKKPWKIKETVLFVRIFSVRSCPLVHPSPSLLNPGRSGAVTLKDDAGRCYHLLYVVDIIQLFGLSWHTQIFIMVLRY